MKRTGLILGIIFALAAVGVAIFLLLSRIGGGEATPRPVAEDPFSGIGGGDAIREDTVVPELGVPVQGAGEEVGPQLYKITDGPVAHGSAIFATTSISVQNGTSTAVSDTEVRYIDRASGNMYRFQLRTRTLERITNLTLPGIQEAAWVADGSRAFLRFLSSETGAPRMETYALPASGGNGYFLEAGLADVAVNATSSVLSLRSTNTGSVATRATPAGTSPATLFTSTLSALRILPSGNSYAAFTKPSALLPGYAFAVSAGGELNRVLGPLDGLSVLPSPGGKRFLYSYVEGRSVRLAVIDEIGGAGYLLPVATIAEKCAWAADSLTAYCAVPKKISGSFPDDWYAGAVRTEDRIWKIDIANRVASLVVDPSSASKSALDAVSLATDGKEDALVFTNRNDGSLWLYDF